MDAVDARNVSFRYGQADDAPALESVSLGVAPGECVVLCGASGCGKTTFTRVVNGLAPSFFRGTLSGDVLTCGLDAARVPIDRLTPLVGSVFQNPKTQYFNANTTDELAFPCENMGMDAAEINRRVADAAGRFGVTDLLDRGIFRLSGGQKQRVAMAAAVVLGPRLVVLDEPTGNLDAQAIDAMRDLVVRMKADGVSVLVAEHRLAWLNGVADRYAVFDAGRIVREYPADEFLALSPDHVAAMGLRTLDPEPCRRAVARLAAVPAEGDGPDGRTALLRTRDLVVGHGRGRRRAFSRTVPDLSLARGEIVGLMGRNGTGKTTLVRTLTGLAGPLSGRIELDGRTARPRDLMRAGFMVMQDVNYQLFSDSVREELMIGSDADDADACARCDRVLADLDLPRLADRHPMSLSGGQKQRVAIGSALMCGKDLIVLDEPTSGLDRFHMEQVGRLLRRLAQRGRAVLVVTHDEELAAGWCDRVIDLEAARG
ncbi:energy-coupling factor ABC transporter ATP-binding protein [Bifidobacterium sp. MA2]|uniref:Energy-coupling factor ABC transporter ATP-binding protein n=1 Tax=Bifidobacterium santillanense TaxID=2809028 RepID=A0ABS5URA5_9BIFI|nr:energy-coupling factor ABC transporter ATP-binding protein [Bifidobacterium santillanense]MBT1173410.1 energy-coupling factor ABC transporter ATP-binding protein [Bifidobacterium santillanense]